MSAAKRFEVRAGEYYDSAVLMQLQRSLTGLAGVIDAGVVMGTPANLELLRAADLEPDGAERVRPEDLLLVVKAADPETAEAALGQVDELLARRPTAQPGTFRPRSLTSALKALPAARWVLISIPGRYAAGVAGEALDAGRHVFLYSDNVALEDEIRLKQRGRAQARLVMGPDCGTALINGVGFGFANRVRRGPVGLVSASGTGLQAVSVHLHRLGSGVSHAIGTGGRDLSEEVGGLTTLQGLELLAADPGTRVIVLVSKPPGLKTVGRLLSAAHRVEKPVVVYFLGHPPPGRRQSGLHFASSLEDAAEIAAQLAETDPVPRDPPDSAVTNRPAGFLRGLFAGGTLAAETLNQLAGVLEPLYSNVPIFERQRLEDPLQSRGHTILDLGADEFTVGRLHPMMDNELRIRRIHGEADDPETGLILLDVVLGEGAHPDPAGELAPAIERVVQREGLEVAVVLLGTEQDLQNLEEQAARLREAGARVFRRLSQAVEYVRRTLRAGGAEAAGAPPGEDFQTPVRAVNVGLEVFHSSLLEQGAEAVQVDWRPPAGGDEKLMSILDKMKGGAA